MKTISVNTTIAELVKSYPEIKDIMVSLGFDQIVNPIMLNTAGRIMTLKKGAEMRKADLNMIKEKFLEYGFELTD